MKTHLVVANRRLALELVHLHVGARREVANAKPRSLPACASRRFASALNEEKRRTSRTPPPTAAISGYVSRRMMRPKNVVVCDSLRSPNKCDLVAYTSVREPRAVFFKHEWNALERRAAIGPIFKTRGVGGQKHACQTHTYVTWRLKKKTRVGSDSHEENGRTTARASAHRNQPLHAWRKT